MIIIWSHHLLNIFHQSRSFIRKIWSIGNNTVIVLQTKMICACEKAFQAGPESMHLRSVIIKEHSMWYLRMLLMAVKMMETSLFIQQIQRKDGQNRFRSIRRESILLSSLMKMTMYITPEHPTERSSCSRLILLPEKVSVRCNLSGAAPVEMIRKVRIFIRKMAGTIFWSRKAVPNLDIWSRWQEAVRSPVLIWHMKKILFWQTAVTLWN